MAPTLVFSSPVQDPDQVVQQLNQYVLLSLINAGFLLTSSGPRPSCPTTQSKCYHGEEELGVSLVWNRQSNRRLLAVRPSLGKEPSEAIGFGKHAIGGRDGKIYVVTDSSDHDSVNPKPGTLRHAVIQDEPLWIIFARDMKIKLKEELLMNSFKTIDGRGADIHIAGGPCITVQYVTNIIIHGINIHDCKRGRNAYVRDSPSHYSRRTISNGDRVSIFGGSHVWVDHCSLSNYNDGLFDAIHGADPTINSQGNRFLAPNDADNKEVTKHEDAPQSQWKHWNWRSEGDLMLNGAFFIASGTRASSSYAKASSLGARPSSLVNSLTAGAGALVCKKGSRC
ncbi:putative pectate lyase 5 [Hibiscus syriacus]|uniref:Pectate lyase n=1 Tax=Hibiscus syriacus TaxID=106335 RepID=A0A6A3BNX6_HIBSY|nr:putative pectate lyase 5 [Hibiscus syriacus]